jgi:hypothetical protein
MFPLSGTIILFFLPLVYRFFSWESSRKVHSFFQIYIFQHSIYHFPQPGPAILRRLVNSYKSTSENVRKTPFPSAADIFLVADF